jgi:hypothetical protein
VVQSWFKIVLTDTFTHFIAYIVDKQCPEAVNATRQVALRANAANDLNTAYFYHRKAEVLNACLVHGITDFFNGLHDPDTAMVFFDRVGPPPGYEDDFWGKLVHSYKEGDHLQQQIKRQDYQSSNMMETATIELPPTENTTSIVSDIKSLLPHKYFPSSSIQSPVSHPVLALEPKTTTTMQSQSQERSLLIQEFVQTGLPLLLNWLLSLTPTSRFAVLEQCISDVVLTSSLDSVLSSRQRSHLLPEISDIPMLVGDGVENLQHLIIRVASGQENNWSTDISAVFEIQETHSTFVHRLGLASESARTAILSELDFWARENAQQYWFNVPAVLRIEFSVESAILGFAPVNDLPPAIARSNIEFEDFNLPFALYRTRGLQLFTLSLIEKCLKTCLPSNPPTQNKKRKRHM